MVAVRDTVAAVVSVDGWLKALPLEAAEETLERDCWSCVPVTHVNDDSENVTGVGLVVILDIDDDN